MIDFFFSLVPFAFISPRFDLRAFAVLDASFSLGQHVLGSKEYWRDLAAAFRTDFLLGQGLHAQPNRQCWRTSRGLD
jgi:hypothetical protein